MKIETLIALRDWFEEPCGFNRAAVVAALDAEIAEAEKRKYEHAPGCLCEVAMPPCRERT